MSELKDNERCSDQEEEQSCSDYDDSDDEFKSDDENESKQLPQYNNIDDDDEEENWESDDFWVPNPDAPNVRPSHAYLWQAFLERKITNGSFCPIDIHPKKIQKTPVVNDEVFGQFDDASSDEEKK